MLTQISTIVLFIGHLLSTQGSSTGAGTNGLKGPGYQQVIDVSFDAESHIYLVEENFISFTLDSYAFLEHLRNFNATDVKYQNVARGLIPAMLRVGGTEADRLVFRYPDRGFQVIAVEDFDKVCEFTKVVGWNMSFDLNLLYRNNSQWNASDALMIMTYATSKGYTLDLELGNEPDLYKQTQRVAPDQIGRDFVKLREIMNSMRAYEGRRLFGPSISSGAAYVFLGEFLQTGSRAIDAISVHHYYCSGKDLTPSMMVDPNVLDSIDYTISASRAAIKKNSKGTQTLWLAEAGLAWSASAPDTSGFIAGFMWMDTLGMSASNNVTLVARQTFGNLVGDNATPTPEYWLTFLFKKLIGQRVLKVSTNENNGYFRIYAHCSLTHAGGVAFYYMNLYNNTVSWALPSYEHQIYDMFHLTAGGNGTMSSSIVNLNGVPISMNGLDLPVLSPVTSQIWPVSVPALSYGFLVVPNAGVNACR